MIRFLTVGRFSLLQTHFAKLPTMGYEARCQAETYPTCRSLPAPQLHTAKRLRRRVSTANLPSTREAIRMHPAHSPTHCSTSNSEAMLLDQPVRCPPINNFSYRSPLSCTAAFGIRLRLTVGHRLGAVSVSFPRGLPAIELLYRRETASG